MAKTVLVTGCSSGIGRECVERFAEEGWNVAATMRAPDRAEGFPGRENVRILELDVCNEDSVNAGVAAATDAFGAIDAAINNAAYSENGPLEFASDAAVERQFSTNIAGPVRVMRAVLPQMRERRSGVIVNITSGAGRIGFPLSSLYCASKFAVEGLTEATRFELMPLGIRVKIVEPGFTDSRFFDNSNQSSNPHVTDYNPLIEKVLRKYIGSRGEYSTPAQIAQAIYQATIDESDRLRYPAGADVAAMFELRDSEDDDTVFQAIQAYFD